MKYLIMGLMALLTISCASLKINVDVYNGDLPPLTKHSTRFAQDVMNAPWFDKATHRKSAFKSILDDIEKKYFELTIPNYKKQAELQAQEKKENKTSAQLDDIAREWAKSDLFDDTVKDKPTGLFVLIREEWKKYDAGAKAVHDKAKASFQLSSATVGTTLKNEALKQFREFKAEYGRYMELLNPRLFFEYLYSTLALKGIPKEEIDILIARSELKKLGKTIPGIAASEHVEGKMVGYPIFDPRIPSLSRNDKDWENFNSTKFSARFGNAQFVAVREGLVVFHKKGLDFDPTPIIGAGTATAKLGIKVAGAIASGTTGIPINLLPEGQDSSPSSSGAGGQDEILFNEVEADSMKISIETRNRARKKMLSELGRLLEKVENKIIEDADAVKEYERIIYFYLGQIPSTEE